MHDLPLCVNFVHFVDACIKAKTVVLSVGFSRESCLYEESNLLTKPVQPTVLLVSVRRIEKCTVILELTDVPYPFMTILHFALDMMFFGD